MIEKNTPLTKLSAEDIKAKLIDYLLESKNKPDLIACEVPYANKKRWADLLCFNKKHLHAFEIKSELDSLEKLEGQIEDYLDTFSYTTVVIAEKHYLQALQLIPEAVGIIQINQNGVIKTKRKALMRKSLSLYNLIFFLWKEDILRFFPFLEKKKETSELRRYIINNIQAKKIQNLAIESLKLRYKRRFESFKQEKGRSTSLEDLEVLTLLSKKNL